MEYKDYEKLSIINVKNKLNLTEGYCNGNSIYVYCPFCGKEDRKTANLRLNVDLDSYYCNCCGESGYAVGLYAKCNYISTKTAFKRLMSQDSNMQTSLQYIKKANKRSSSEISIVYEYLLKMLGLNKKHCKMLLQMGFTKEEILNGPFRSIPQYENERIKLCNRLLKCGFRLSGVPGFYLNQQMKWTFKSHKGFFIPVIDNDEIKGLRIHLENEYKLKTTDIWFSSANEYQGSASTNNIMIFMPDSERKLGVFDINNIPKKDIVITSEILLGYRLFLRDNKITIAIPNKISKKLSQNILNNMNINSADIYIDEHTIRYDYSSIYKNLINHIPEEKENINFIFNYKDLIKDEIGTDIKKVA